MKLPFGLQRHYDNRGKKLLICNQTQSLYLSYGGDIYKLNIQVGRFCFLIDPPKRDREARRGL